MEGDGGRGEEKTYTFFDAALPFLLIFVLYFFYVLSWMIAYA